MSLPAPRRFTPRAHVRTLAGAALLALAFAGPATATPDATAQGEIDHLLDFVGTSSCTFVRNGAPGTADAARKHLEFKYTFAKSRLTTAEDFILHLATSSSTSGEPYKIICNKKERPAGAWLADELARYRKVTQAAR
jgi:uncharacterized protein DUF5329